MVESRPTIETLRLQWSIALSEENHRMNRETADVIHFNKNLDITGIEQPHLSGPI